MKEASKLESGSATTAEEYRADEGRTSKSQSHSRGLGNGGQGIDRGMIVQTNVVGPNREKRDVREWDQAAHIVRRIGYRPSNFIFEVGAEQETEFTVEKINTNAIVSQG